MSHAPVSSGHGCRPGYDGRVHETVTASAEMLDPANPSADPRPVPPRSQRYWIFGSMAVFGLISFIASFVLSVDALVLAGNPDADLACTIDAVFDCAAVGATWQANLLGFPNAFFGIATSVVLIVIAVAGLSGTRFPRWFMVGAHLGFLAGVIFAYWLLYQSTFVIGAMCIWCLTVCLATTIVFWNLTSWNFQEHNHYFGPAVGQKLERFVAGGWLSIVFMAWLALVISVELVKWLPLYI